MAQRIDLTKTFANMCDAARAAGLNTTGLYMQKGSSTNGIAYRVYRITDEKTRRQEEWNYAPPGGYLGMTRTEAARTLDTMRYVFFGFAMAGEE